MLNKKRYGQSGVSLIEVLIALFIMSVVGVAILAGTYVNIKSTGEAREGIRAEGLAKYELERVKSVATDNWSDITNSTTIYNGSDRASEYAGYTVTVTIELLPSAPYNNNTNIRKVTATVKNSKGNTEATIETYVVKPP
jgi:prepilin-type N-terminal cleavage/methylation domain-containing protein